MFTIFGFKCTQNYIYTFTIISILLYLIIYLYFSNYIRKCYYASKFHGPLAYPIVGNALVLLGSLENTTKYIIHICSKYSSFRFWFGPIPLIVTSDPKMVQEVLTNENLLEKSYLMKLMWNFVMGKSILTSDVPEWKRHRSIIIQGFSPIILKSFFKIFVDKINILTEKLDMELNKEKSFDIFDYITKTTLDVVCGSSMGVDIHAHEHDSDYCNAMYNALQLMMSRIKNVLKIPHQFYRFTEDYQKALKTRQILWSFTDQLISNKKYQNFLSPDFHSMDSKVGIRNEYKKPLLDYLMDLTKNNFTFTDEQLRNEINLIIMASYETTATALSYVLLNLAVYKDIQTKVYDELCNVFGEINTDTINIDDLSKLKFMEMVIKESMRLSPTIPIIGREASKDIQLGKYIVSKGSIIVIPMLNLHRNKDYWENPLKFDPERFTSENIKNQHPYAYIPFSGGPRNCIGTRYAWILMKLILTILLNRYEFHTDVDLNKLRYEFSVSLKLIGGHQLRITPRQKSSEKSVNL